MNRRYIEEYSSFIIAFYQDISATIVLTPLLFIFHPIFHIKDILFLFLLGMVFTSISHSLFITTVKAQTASVINSLEPVYGIIFAIFIVKELPTSRITLGDNNFRYYYICDIKFKEIFSNS